MKKRRVLKILLPVLIVFVVGFAVMAFVMGNAHRSLIFESIEMSEVADGTYEGDAEAVLVYAKVAVTVQNHEIINVEILEHRNGMGSKAETITQDIMEQNTYEVDAISSATLSSDAIKSAVSKALKQGVRE